MSTNGKLNNAQKDQIALRVRNGESGSVLAREFGVSRSFISGIKKNWIISNQSTLTVKKTKKNNKAITSTKTKVKTKQRKFILYSNKLIKHEYNTNVETFGELLKELELNNIKGIFTNITNNQKIMLKNNNDILPSGTICMYFL